MIFSSLLFLFLFLPAFLVAYYLTPNRHRNITAVLASLIFYAWGAPRFLFVLVGCAVIDYNIGLLIFGTKSLKARKAWLALSLSINVGLLIFFKYANFGVDQLNSLLTAVNLNPIGWARIALPIGISFFTFHKISYMVDVYRGVTAPSRTFSTYLLYLLFFPQLIAGPIIRYHDVAGQLDYRRHTMDRFLSGLWRFCLGLGKKVLIANALGETVKCVFDGSISGITPIYAWIGVFAFTFQLYFDFSGYSDMAIGLGRMAGIEFLENFNMPYIASTFTEFWRRWHISLSSFMREYLYVPLGGNRVSKAKSYRNLWIVFLISGIWHGAAWPFVAWGAFHGFFLTLDKLFWTRASKKLPKLVTLPLTFFFLMIGWVLFRSETMTDASSYLLRMFCLTSVSSAPPVWADVISNRAATMMLLAVVFSFAPAIPRIRRLTEVIWLSSKPGIQVARSLLALLLLLLSACSLANATFNPFIYFRF
jgi:alginate O-acetyltransferase complex protein AlgI